MLQSLYLFTILAGAFLVFQIQPMIAKIILPFFGGGAAVWTDCMLVFQCLLLFGYFYSFCLTKINNLRVQAGGHLFLLCLSLYSLPIGLNGLNEAMLDQSPVKNIILLLTTSIGLPYIMLAATGPLLQRWLTYENYSRPPYFLYSVSNIGSLLAVLTYPFLFEPFLSLPAQASFWGFGYILYLVGAATICLTFLCKTKIRKEQKIQAGLHVTKREIIQILLWLLLSGVGVIILISTTNSMTQNIQPIPFLWLLPLCIYLLTYIISFHSDRSYVRWYWFAIFSFTSLAAILMFFIGSHFDLVSQLGIYSAILLSACMICHGELAALKPSAERLTLFYLIISLGGLLGSIFIVFFAQKLMTNYYEFPLAIISTCLLMTGCMLWHKYVLNINGSRTFILLLRFSVILPIVLSALFMYLNTRNNENDVVAIRNFYGILKVKDVLVNGRSERRLIDGTTSHGTQVLTAKDRGTPVSYYRNDTGVALALKHRLIEKPIKVGIIGLGIGTLAAYGRDGDSFRFYELNPAVEFVAATYFTYLTDTSAQVDIVLGDARVSLSREMVMQGSQQFDVIVMDAFTGGAIPTHLLTKEAFDLYWTHLAPSGVLAIHISNSHLNLSSLIREIALSKNKSSRYFKSTAEGYEVNDAEWIVVTDDEQFFDIPEVKRFVTMWPDAPRNPHIWTDDYSNLFSILK